MDDEESSPRSGAETIVQTIRPSDILRRAGTPDVCADRMVELATEFDLKRQKLTSAGSSSHPPGFEKDSEFVSEFLRPDSRASVRTPASEFLRPGSRASFQAPSGSVWNDANLVPEMPPWREPTPPPSRARTPSVSPVKDDIRDHTHESFDRKGRRAPISPSSDAMSRELFSASKVSFDNNIPAIPGTPQLVDQSNSARPPTQQTHINPTQNFSPSAPSTHHHHHMTHSHAFMQARACTRSCACGHPVFGRAMVLGWLFDASLKGAGSLTQA